MALSEEEAAMNGAPEGELFTVELLQREQIEPFDSEEEAIDTLETLLGDIKTVDQWHLQFEILTSIRRLAAHHPDLLAKNKLGLEIMPFVAAQAKSARSSVARNGLMAIDDLLASCSVKLKESSTLVAETLLESMASNQPKVIRATATTALDT